MKFTKSLFLLCFLANILFTISAQTSVLNKQVEIKNSSTTGYELINYLQNTTGFSINYSESVIKVAKYIKLTPENYSVKVLLDKIFVNQQVDYIVKTEKILVKPRTQKSGINEPQNQNFISIKGKITEAKTGEPVGFASICVKNQAIGTVSNNDGGFIFHIPGKYKNDSLFVSSIGYKSYGAKISTLSSKKIKIELEKKVYDLSEIKIKPKDPKEIMEEAIARIPENYPQKPINMDAFYREMTFENDTCVQLGEAISKLYYRPYGEKYDRKEAYDIYYDGFKKVYNDYYNNPFSYIGAINPKDEIQLTQIRCSKLNHKHRFKVIPLGGIHSMLWHDFLKRRLPYGNDKFFKKHKLKLLDIVQINGRAAYKIYSKPNPHFKTYRNIWYIDIETYAIVAIEYFLLEWKYKSNRYWTPALYNKKKRRCKDIEYSKIFKTSFKYRPLENKWVLKEVKHQATFEHVFSKHYKFKKTEEKIDYEIFIELYVNDVEQEKVTRIPDSLQCKNIVSSTLYENTLNYNKDFWAKYNVPPLTQFQDSAIIQLERFEPLEQQFANRTKRNDSLPPPIAKKITATNPNTNQTDNYFWLQNAQNIEVLNYIEEENNFTKNFMLPLKKTEQNLYSEIIRREKKDTINQLGKKKNGIYEYYLKKYAGFYNIYRKQVNSPKEELILDVQKKSRFHPNYWAEIASISPDNKYFAYTEPVTDGYDSRIVFKDLETRKNIDSIDKAGSIIWEQNNKYFLYTKWDETNWVNAVYRHKIGSKTKNDQLIYQENNKTNNVNLSYYEKKYIILDVSNDFYENSMWLVEQEGTEIKLKPIVQQKKGFSHYCTIKNDTLYNLTKQADGKTILYSASIENPEIDNWKKIIENTGNDFFDGFYFMQDYIALLEKENMHTKVRIIDKTGNTVNTIDFKQEESYSIHFNYKEDLAINTFRYSYSSLATPTKIFEYDIDKKQTTFIKQNLPIGFIPKKYKTKLIWATSKDGTKVPVSLVYNKKLVKRNRKSPVLLYAYGSYGASQEPSFSSARLSLLDRGFVYAVAHVRGGSELGKKWHEGAMQMNKKNTFYDYIACAEQLIKEKYTMKGEIVARGGSAGGLTMGAVANMRPDLFNTVILEAPYLDVLSTLSDTTAKFCLLERVLLGNPAKPEVFDYIKSYSPYQSITKQNYPNMLFTAGLLDSRVDYWNALKSVAKLRALKTDKNNLLLKMDIYAGHNSYVGKYNETSYEAFVYAFIFNNLNMKY